MGPMLAAEGVRRGSKEAYKHRKGIAAMGVVVGGLVLVGGALTLKSCKEDPALNVEEKTVMNEAPVVKITKVTGLRDVCFVEQETVVNMRIGQEPQIDASIPTPFGGIPLLHRSTPPGTTRWTEKDVGGKAELCVKAKDVEIYSNRINGVPQDLHVDVKQFTRKSGLDANLSDEKPVEFAFVDELPMVKYDNGDVSDFGDKLGQALIGKYACNKYTYQIATTEGTGYYQDLGRDIGNIPPQNIFVTYPGMPSAEESAPNGRISNEDVGQLLGVNIPDTILTDVEYFNCSAIAVDSSDNVVPTWQWEEETSTTIGAADQQAAGIPG